MAKANPLQEQLLKAGLGKKDDSAVMLTYPTGRPDAN